MQDLKTGSLLKASPRSQFYGQMIGSFASVFVSVGAYKLYTRIYEVSRRSRFMSSSVFVRSAHECLLCVQIPGPEFQVPTAAIW